MERITAELASIDALAEKAGGYFSIPSKDSMEYTELLFDICRQFGIRYYSASSKEREFVEEVTRVTWARQREAESGIKLDVRPAFSA